MASCTLSRYHICSEFGNNGVYIFRTIWFDYLKFFEIAN